MTILQVLYLLLVGYLIYSIVKRGGCCGSHSHHSKHTQYTGSSFGTSHESNEQTKSKFLTEDEKKKAIDI